jgi:hypothetical protein
MSLALLETVRDQVERDFRQANFDHDRFAAIAEAALIEADFPRNFRFDFDELTRWVLAPGHVTPRDSSRLFSNLPVSVAWGTGFFVELLLWTTSAPSIHQHSFSGAFTVAQGSSIHSQFRIDTLERITEAVQLVKGSLVTTELLQPGMVRRITAGSQLTHSTFHLGEPTISIVVRTAYEPWHLPQLSLLPPHYTYAPAWLRRDGQIDYLTRAFQVMSTISAPDFMQVALDRFGDLDFGRALLLLAETFQLFIGPDLERVLARFKEAHGRLADGLPAVAKRYDLEARISRLRHVTADEDQRFALAVLMVAQDHEQARRILSTHPRGEALITESEIPAMAKFWRELGA